MLTGYVTRHAEKRTACTRQFLRFHRYTPLGGRVPGTMLSAAPPHPHPEFLRTLPWASQDFRGPPRSLSKIEKAKRGENLKSVIDKAIPPLEGISKTSKPQKLQKQLTRSEAIWFRLREDLYRNLSKPQSHSEAFGFSFTATSNSASNT